ncbi:MAG: hypothetical protein U1F43_11495 [Myxococcota bacterium]
MSSQKHISNPWVIERAEVERARRGDGARAVPAFKVPVPGSVHFLADYDDSDGIRIQCAPTATPSTSPSTAPTTCSSTGGRSIHRPDVAGRRRIGQYATPDPAARRLTQASSSTTRQGIAPTPAARARLGRAARAPEVRLLVRLWPVARELPSSCAALRQTCLGRIILLAEVDRLVAQGGMPPALVRVDLEGFRHRRPLRLRRA